MKKSTVTNVEYMALYENLTVRYILEQSLAASHEVGQEYAIVTFDLAKVYDLVCQFTEKFKNDTICFVS